MSMTDWAREEVRLACKRENPEWDGESFDYGCCCYKNALEAFEVITKEGHSGMSYGITVGILKRLLERKPLTPIEDTPDVWSEVRIKEGGTKTFQCRRMSSLFKTIDENGKVSYDDIDRAVGIDDEGMSWRIGKVSDIVDELFPITMPYAPPLGTYKMKVSEKMLGGPDEVGSYDTLVCHELTTPQGEKIKIDRYFTGAGREKEEEITKEEFLKLCEEKAEREKKS